MAQKLLFSLVILLAISNCVLGQGRVWSGVEFFTNPEFCNNNDEYPKFTFCGVNVPNLETSIFPTNSSDIISWAIRGPWAYYTGTEYTSADGSGEVGLVATDPEYTFCVSYLSDGQPLSFRVLGNPDPELPGLSLFYGVDANGRPEPNGDPIYIDQDATDFVIPFPVNYWALTAYENWTLYTETNFAGDSVCIDPYHIDEGDYMKAWGWGDLLQVPGFTQVGSVRRGCLSEVIIGPDSMAESQVDNQNGNMIQVVGASQRGIIQSVNLKDKKGQTKYLESCVQTP